MGLIIMVVLLLNTLHKGGMGQSYIIPTLKDDQQMGKFHSAQECDDAIVMRDYVGLYTH